MAATPKSQLEQDLDAAQDDILAVKDILEEAYAPESTREVLAEAIGRALERLEDYESMDEEDEESEDYSD